MPIDVHRPGQGRRLLHAALGAATVLVLGACTAAESAAPPAPAAKPLQYATQLQAAAAAYREYVTGQAVLLQERTAAFTAAVTDGDVAGAKALYPAARAPWERIQVATEELDLEGAIDGSGVGLAPGERFTGFHRLERDLWVDGLQPDSAEIAGTLLADVDTLAAGTGDLELDGHALCGGAKELIDFAITSTLPGRESRHAGTDLADMSARVEGSKAAVDALRPLLAELDPALLGTVDRRFAELRAVLDTHRRGAAFRPHPELSGGQLAALADALDAVGEPVSKLGGKVMA